MDPYPNTYQPAYGLWQLYHPDQAPYRFSAQTLEEAQQWQARTRSALQEVVGFANLPYKELAPVMIEEVEKQDYIRQKWVLNTWEHAQMPVYLLIPKQARQPTPVVLAFHGHGYGVKDIVGLWEDGSERETPDGYHADFGVSLCRSGFVVAAPEIACFGERQSDFSYLKPSFGQEIPSTCTHTAMLAFHLGGSVVGWRVFEARRLIDFLETLPLVDSNRIGAMGISGGGTLTFFSTCLDTRIRACVISGYYSTFQNSILAMHHCACNFVPGLGKFGEMYDLAGLIAPRPILIEAGTHDPIFPLEAVLTSLEMLRKNIYPVFNTQNLVESDIFEGRHRIHGQHAIPFLQRILSVHPNQVR